MKILFIGDIFGNDALDLLHEKLPGIIKKEKIDFTIAQGENVSKRKGLIKRDFNKMLDAGINAVTMGNHVWAKDRILDFIKRKELIRPYNIDISYPGHGTSVFDVNGKTIRVTSMLGISFNPLRGQIWEHTEANNFFDAFDHIETNEQKTDYHIIDFHAETTSEKNVFGLYLDGKVTALLGTHTHVQTNDAKIFSKGTMYITDAGMTGPMDSAIGASFETVYKKMRYDEMIRFEISDNPIQLNGVILDLEKNTIKTVNGLLDKM